VTSQDANTLAAAFADTATGMGQSCVPFTRTADGDGNLAIRCWHGHVISLGEAS
jgi:hypothetical protein